VPAEDLAAWIDEPRRRLAAGELRGDVCDSKPRFTA